MKKKSGTARVVPEIGRAELDSLATKELLARLQRLQVCEGSFGASDMSEDDDEDDNFIEGQESAFCLLVGPVAPDRRDQPENERGCRE